MSLAAATCETKDQASPASTRRAVRPMTTAISPSKPSSSQPCGRSTVSPSPLMVDGGLRKYEG